MLAVEFEPTTFQSISGGATPWLIHYLNHSATEDGSSVFYVVLKVTKIIWHEHMFEIKETFWMAQLYSWKTCVCSMWKVLFFPQREIVDITLDLVGRSRCNVYRHSIKQIHVLGKLRINDLFSFFVSFIKYNTFQTIIY